MVCKLGPTGASPCTCKPITICAFISGTFLFCQIMLLIRMLTKTFKIISAMSRYVIKAFTFTFWSFTHWLLSLWIKIFVLFETMVTETFSLWSYHLTLYLIGISPA